MSPFLWFIWWSDVIAAYAPKEKPRKPELRVIEGGAVIHRVGPRDVHHAARGVEDDLGAHAGLAAVRLP